MQRLLLLPLFAGLILAAAPLAAQNYVGTMTYDQSTAPGYHAVLVADLHMANGQITGNIGIGQPGTNPPATIPITGTVNGQTCTIAVQAGMVMTGTCNPSGFSGTYRVGVQTGVFNLRGPSAPMPGPAPAPVRSYCGTFSNTTYNIGGPFSITLNNNAAFAGHITVGPKTTGPGQMETYGSGDFTGTWQGTSCQGTATSKLRFQGTCDANSIRANYTIDGQQGSFSLTTAACR